MTKALSQQDVHQLALVGAKARLEILQAEMKALVASFPELAGGRGRRAAPSVAATSSPSTRRKKRRYTMTAEQKQAVSERMKKYWASRRKEKNR